MSFQKFKTNSVIVLVENIILQQLLYMALKQLLKKHKNQ